MSTFSKKPLVTQAPAEEAMLPVNLLRWEDDVILDGDRVQPPLLEALNCGREPKCGWITTQQTRTYESYRSAFAKGLHILTVEICNAAAI